MPTHGRLVLLLTLIGALAGCERRGGCTGPHCGTVIITAIGEPTTLLPASVDNVVGRDIHDQVFLKLADVGMSMNTLGDEDFQPQLAERWEWDGPLTLVFHIDPRARWQDGHPVTAADVAFTFDAYTDSVVASTSRAALRRIASVTQRDSLTAVFRFRERYPEMFYDAVYQMRILPGHLLRQVPRDQWRTAAFGRQPVGNGPYRFVRWQPGQSIELTADSTFFLGRPLIRRVIWRFTPDVQVAVTQVLANQADVREQLITPENVTRARTGQHIRLIPYRGNTYGYFQFNLRANGDTSQAHPLFGDREVRRALAMAVDRARMARNALGEMGKVPPGPMSELVWIWNPEIRQLPYDTAQAGRMLGARGWRDHDGDGVRDKDGQPLAFHILVPTTSAVRRQYARLLQEQLRLIGVRVEIDELEPAVVGQRATAGRFDAVIMARGNDPSPSSGIRQIWTPAGFGASNFGRYDNPAFERLVDRAISTFNRDQARSLWRAAIETFNADAPAISLFAIQNIGAFHERIENVQIRPDSWVALLRQWRIPSDRLIDRDRVEQ